MGVIRRGDKFAVKVSEGGRQRWLGTFADKVKADRAYAEWVLRRRAPERMPFNELAFDWLSGISVRDRTWADYVTTCEQLVTHFNDIPVCDITPKDIDRFVPAMARRYQPNTVRKQVTRLRQILRAAVRWGYLPSSPADGRLSLPPVQKRRVTPMSPEEAWRLVEAADTYWRPLFLTAITTGLRQAELLGLRWSDVDLKAGTVTVRKTMFEGKLEPPKSEAAKRTIFLPAVTVEALKAHDNVCPATDQDLVFPAPWGRWMNTKTFSESVMVPTAKRAGCPDVRLHDLRHCFASLMIRSGQSMKFLQSVMGHSTITVTIDTYGHLFPGEGQQAAQALGEWLGRSSSVAAENPSG